MDRVDVLGRALLARVAEEAERHAADEADARVVGVEPGRITSCPAEKPELPPFAAERRPRQCARVDDLERIGEPTELSREREPLRELDRYPAGLVESIAVERSRVERPQDLVQACHHRLGRADAAERFATRSFNRTKSPES